MDILSVRICPYISCEEDVKTMLKESFGLTVVSMKSLNGYEDRNYHVTVTAEHSNEYIKDVCAYGYLVKFVNDYDSKIEDFNMGQKILMDHLNSYGVKCQEEIKNVKGEFFSKLTVDKNGKAETYKVCVRTYIPGIVVNEITIDEHLAFEMGSFTAKICKALQDFKFPFYDTFKPEWDMDNFLNVRKALPAVNDAKQKQVAVEVLNAFESEVLPRKDEYKKGQIHGDLNEQNILVEKKDSGIHICGLLDFQESALTCCIYDFSNNIAYMMMLPDSGVPIMDIGGHMLAGYESVIPIGKVERETLKILIAGRMVMSLVYGAFFHSLDPTNDYLLVTSRVGWASLIQLWETPDEKAWKRWNEIINACKKGNKLKS